jgi:uncharacterized membrane protein (DUF441 family)
MSDYGRSVVRTLVPVVVGVLVTWLASKGLDVDRGQVTVLVEAVVSVAYYALVRLAEQRVPQLGWLLGVPGAPTYGAGQGVTGPEYADPSGANLFE